MTRSTQYRYLDFRAALNALVLLALAAPALTPPGYMLAPTTPGAVTVVLCTGHGPVEVALDPGDAPSRRDSPQQDQNAGAPCLFAAAANQITPPHPAVLAAPQTASVATKAPAPQDVEASPLAAPPPWATGPPPRG